MPQRGCRRPVCTPGAFTPPKGVAYPCPLGRIFFGYIGGKFQRPLYPLPSFYNKKNIVFLN